LAKYFDITWIIHHGHYDDINTQHYSNENHKIIVTGEKPKRNNIYSNNSWLIPFYFLISKHLKKNRYDLIFIHLERFCFLLPIFSPNQNYALQLFTAAISHSKLKNMINNLEQKFHIMFFHKIIIGTSWMSEKFKLGKKQVICPKWGHVRISSVPKCFDAIRLLYVGTLTNRRIHETAQGLSIFLKNNQVDVNVSYDIIGTGNDESIAELKRSIKQYGLSEIVTLHGFLSDAELAGFFDTCNVGIAYIPITDYYNNVVATKLIEYHLSGMVAIATETNENIKTVSSNNGVLINDNPLSFADGLLKVYENLKNWSSEKIFKESEVMTTEYLVKTETVLALKSLM